MLRVLWSVGAWYVHGRAALMDTRVQYECMYLHTYMSLNWDTQQHRDCMEYYVPILSSRVYPCISTISRVLIRRTLFPWYVPGYLTILSPHAFPTASSHNVPEWDPSGVHLNMC